MVENVDSLKIPEKMIGAILPGNSTVELKEFDVPEPGYGQVLVATRASTICGSDIRAIYREHTGKGAEGYIPGTIAGHEPCGIIVKEGPGLKQFKKGDRVIVYHISGCGIRYNCRRGFMVACTSPKRQAYGWQRNGGMAPYMLCDEKDLIALPDELTYEDGASVACGFGTSYEALEKIGINRNDAVLVVGLGPVGLATLMLSKALGADKLIGVEMSDYRIEFAKKLGLVDYVFKPGDDTVQKIKDVTGGFGVEKAIDCSGSNGGRQTAVRATRDYGKIALVGEGKGMELTPSPDLMHPQKTVYGSWVTSTWKMMDLVEHLVRWNLHPGDLITNRFSLDKVGEAYELMAGGQCGKVCIDYPVCKE